MTVIATSFDEDGRRDREEEPARPGRSPRRPCPSAEREREWPAYLRKKAVGAENFTPELSLDQEDLDIPTFLRKQAD